jgi:5-formyltetrahydrofolate cyclo-ligase
LREIRDKISLEDRINFEEAINNNVFEYVINQGKTIVSAYYPIKSEVSLLPVISKLNQLRINLLLPRIKDDILEFRVWDIAKTLDFTGFVPEPPANAEKIIPEIIFLPCLGWDRDGGRLGYGKGFYDRALEAKTASVIKIAIAFDEQEIEKVPTDIWDKKMDLVITQSGVITIG